MLSCRMNIVIMSLTLFLDRKLQPQIVKVAIKQIEIANNAAWIGNIFSRMCWLSVVPKEEDEDSAFKFSEFAFDFLFRPIIDVIIGPILECYASPEIRLQLPVSICLRLCSYRRETQNLTWRSSPKWFSRKQFLLIRNPFRISCFSLYLIPMTWQKCSQDEKTHTTWMFFVSGGEQVEGWLPTA